MLRGAIIGRRLCIIEKRRQWRHGQHALRKNDGGPQSVHKTCIHDGHNIVHIKEAL